MLLSNSSRLLDLPEIELDRSRAPEDRDRHPDLALVVVHVLDIAVEIGKRPVLDPYRLPDFEQHLGPRFLDAFLDLVQDVLHFLLRNGRRLGRGAANKTRHFRRALDQVPGVVGHFHFDQHIARKELALGNVFLTAFHLDDFFHRYQNLAELVLHAGARDAIDQCALHGFLKAGVGVHHVPFLAHVSLRPISRRTAHSNPASTSHRNTAMTATNANTIPVVCSVSLRVGHTTRLVSSIDSCEYAKNSLPGAVVRNTTAPATVPPITARTRTIMRLSDH